VAMTTHQTEMLLLPIEPSAKNSSTAALTVAGIGATSSKMKLSMNRGGCSCLSAR